MRPRSTPVVMLTVALAWVVSGVLVVAMVLLDAVTLGRASMTGVRALVRVWGRVVLRLLGIRLEVEGQEHLTAVRPAIVTYNHTSALDVLVGGALFPAYATAVVKHQTKWIPVVGPALLALGALFVNRGRSKAAVATLQRAVARIRERRLRVFIAPEGTRSPDGALLPFKKGPLWLAHDTDAPIVPIVILGANRLLPKGAWLPQAGVIRVRVLPPRRGDEMAAGGVTEHTEALREVYLQTLAEMRGEPFSEVFADAP